MKAIAIGAVLAVLLLAPGAVNAAAPPAPIEPPQLDEQAIDAAEFDAWRARRDAIWAAEAASPQKAAKKRTKPKSTAGRDPDGRPWADPFVLRVQVLLDRAHVSPGAIDGRDGTNLRKAIQTYKQWRGLPDDDILDAGVWAMLSRDAGKPTRVYEITPEDIAGRFEPNLPRDYGKLAKLKWLGFRDVAEMLAERFHMDERLLRQLNPGADFKSAGQKLLVADTGADASGKVARIVIEKRLGELKAYDEAGTLVFAAPATVGSSDTPSPSGKTKVTAAFANPFYKYDPVKNFRQGRNFRKLTLPPGPNGPVGSMWIDLVKPTYGIHGTPEPEKISKSESHGCVRLTNWDAEGLAKLVQRGALVEFR